MSQKILMVNGNTTTTVILGYNTGNTVKVKNVHCSIPFVYSGGVNITTGKIEISDNKTGIVPNLYQVYVSSANNVYQLNNLNLDIKSGGLVFKGTGNYINYNCSVIYEMQDGIIDSKELYSYIQNIGLGVFTFIIMFLSFILPIYFGYKTAKKITSKQILVINKNKIGKN